MNKSKKSENNVLDCLLNQFEISWQLLTCHLDGLTVEECLWEPTEKGIFLKKSDKNKWKGDFPATEGYEMGPPNIGWLTWHIDYWWSMTINHSFGDCKLDKDAIEWQPSVNHILDTFNKHKDKWLEQLSGLSDQDINSKTFSKWPVQDCPFSDIISWLNVELMKNAAEIGYVRFLYASQDQ